MKKAFPDFWLVTQNSKFITKKSIFFAIKGKNFNGADFILDALQKGASKIVTDQVLSQDVKDAIKDTNVELVEVEDALLELPKYCAKAWKYPAKKLKIFGVTGTKGKTTTTFLLHHILQELGYKVAMISGVKNIIDGYEFKSELTTPHADFIQAFLASCAEQNIEYVVLETSAQALTLHRVDEVEFDGIVFTNLSQEHSEFYPSMEDYFNAKLKIFEKLKKNGIGIVNVDDEWGERFYKESKSFDKFSHRARRPLILSLSKKVIGSSSDFIIKNVRAGFSGLSFELLFKDLINLFPMDICNRVYKISSSKLIGQFNALNCADAFALVVSLGFDSQRVINAIKTFKGVPGRMESYRLKSGALGIVDYAHTPSSYKEVLSALRKLTDNLIVVFGAGGERDMTKRPIMGKIASEYADKIFVTSDNPRSENPELIAQQIISGSELKDKFHKELDREKAIKLAVKGSKKGSIIVVLGKGPDEYQIIGKEKFFFSDKNFLLDL
jgi:UDP-N-acetylmuramoyl-L-alanyl-D-glutamate--2,6-diaminopimelate ligase